MINTERHCVQPPF